MAKKVVRDLIGDPATWENHISDGAAMADMVGATILDILVSGSQLAIYTRSAAGMEALSVFFIDDSELRARVAKVLLPGLDVHEAVVRPID